jgi:hypothetical protein
MARAFHSILYNCVGYSAAEKSSPEAAKKAGIN